MGERLDISVAWRLAQFSTQSECIEHDCYTTTNSHCALSNNRRAALADAGVHKLQQSGIHGDKELGAFSICLSKGYEDNVDRGNIMYVRFLPSRPTF